MAQTSVEFQVIGSTKNDFKCEWIVERFSLLGSAVRKFKESPIFCLSKEGTPYCLRLYPGGITVRNKGYVSLFFYRLINNRQEKIEVDLTLKNTNGEILFDAKKGESEFRMFTCRGYGYQKTLERCFLTSKLQNDTLVIDFRVSHQVTCSKDAEFYFCKENSPPPKMIDDFKNLWRSKENTDFVISVGGSDIPVHSAILGARSKVFAAMIRQAVAEKKTHHLEVTDFEKDTVESLMEFLYSGTIQKLSSSSRKFFSLALDLYRASDKYEVSDLKSHCVSYLMSILSDENIYRLRVAANMSRAEMLRARATRNFSAFLPIKVDRSIFKRRPELFHDAIQRMAESRKTKQPRSDQEENGDNNKKRRRCVCLVKTT